MFLIHFDVFVIPFISHEFSVVFPSTKF